ncbi:hypothetical protein MMC14_009496 [Varicellaria rhodocarpa]|nr:hypothetical protein [Varicellaria rhodocarpa]
MSSSLAPKPTEPISVLFVCLGNICRSPMAEAVFRSLTKANPAVAHIDSAGTGAYHVGDSPDPRTMTTLRRHAITDYRHGARKIQLGDLAKFDYIFAMDRQNLSDLQHMLRRAAKNNQGEQPGEVLLFGDYGGEMGEEVIDPYYGANDGFEVVYQQMVRFTQGFLKEMQDNEKAPQIQHDKNSKSPDTDLKPHSTRHSAGVRLENGLVHDA